MSVSGTTKRKSRKSRKQMYEQRLVRLGRLLQAQAEGEIAAIIARRRTQEARFYSEAVDRLEEGTYGICQECGEKISAARLRAKPSAVLCLSCQSDYERRNSDSEEDMDGFANVSDSWEDSSGLSFGRATSRW